MVLVVLVVLEVPGSEFRILREISSIGSTVQIGILEQPRKILFSGFPVSFLDFLRIFLEEAGGSEFPGIFPGDLK